DAAPENARRSRRRAHARGVTPKTARCTANPGPTALGVSARALVAARVAARRGAADEPSIVREPGCLGAAAGPAPPARVRQGVLEVVVDRLRAEPELAGDLLVRAAGRDPLEDLEFPGCQLEVFGDRVTAGSATAD